MEYVQLSKPFHTIRHFNLSPISFMEQLRRQHGQTVSFKILHRPIHLISDPVLAKVILKNPNFHKARIVFDKMTPFTGQQGLIQLEDPQWESRYNLIKSSFTPQAIQQALQYIQANLENYLPEIAEQEINLYPFISQFTLENTLFTLGFETLPGVKSLSNILTSLNRLCSMKMQQLLPIPDFLLFKSNKQIQSLSRKFYFYIKDLLEREPIRLDSFVDNLRKELPLEEVIQQICTFVFAGFQTTSSAICMSLYQLRHHQDYQNKILTETRDQSLHSLNTLKSLVWTRSYYLETLRLYPPVYMLVREPSKTIELEHFIFEPKQLVMINIYGMHRDPYYWNDSRKFDPDRFTEDSAFQNEAFMPFGCGKRICTGNQLAIFESLVTITTLVKHFHLSSADKIKSSKQKLRLRFNKR